LWNWEYKVVLGSSVEGGPDGVDSKENGRRKIGHVKRTFP